MDQDLQFIRDLHNVLHDLDPIVFQDAFDQMPKVEQEAALQIGTMMIKKGWRKVA